MGMDKESATNFRHADFAVAIGIGEKLTSGDLRREGGGVKVLGRRAKSPQVYFGVEGRGESNGVVTVRGRQCAQQA